MLGSVSLLAAVAAVAPIATAHAFAPAKSAVTQVAEETDDEDPSVAAGDRPTRAPAHADCGHRMPLWIHAVEKGEQIGLIAGRYGVRSADLLALNPDIANPNLIRIGQKIRVCPEIFPRVRNRIEHVVAPGETASAIAAAHDLSVAELVAFQEGKLSDPNRLRAGQTLVLWVDGGLVEDFQPPPPKPATTVVGGKRRVARSGVDMQLAAGSDVLLKRPHLAWGTTKTIRLLESVAKAYRKRAGAGPKVVIGDISRKGGGELGSHLSHRSGRDVDVGYVLRGTAAARTHFSGVTMDNLDVARTWALVKAFLDTHEVTYIFMDYALQEVLYEHARTHGVDQRELDEVFQYPRGRGRNHGIVRHWKSHRHHFHVRFRG